MADYGTLLGNMLTDLNRGQDISARARLAIVNAIEHYTARRFGWNQKRATAQAVSAVEYMELPTDWIENDLLKLETSNDSDILIETTYEWIDEENRNPTYRGRPQYYAIQNRSLRLYPIPDQTYTLHMSFLYQLSDVSLSASDAAANAWTNEGYNLIYSRAMADMLENYIGGEEAWAWAERLRLREVEAEREIKRRANREQSGPGLKPWL